MPMPSSASRRSSCCSKPREASTTLLVIPEACKAFQKRFPGCAKGAFTAAVHGLGLPRPKVVAADLCIARLRDRAENPFVQAGWFLPVVWLSLLVGGQLTGKGPG